MTKKIFLSATTATATLLLTVSSAFAHVTVKPDSVGIGSRQAFSMGVPNEKNNPTVKLRLVVPEGLESVTPNVKPGWTINVKKTGEGDAVSVTEIEWSGGSIPEGQRDDFVFNAKAPSSETKLLWKAYQTYQDGSEVSWDQESVSDSHAEENSDKGPASVTKVIDDLQTDTGLVESTFNGDLTDYAAWVALAFSIAAIAITSGRRTK